MPAKSEPTAALPNPLALSEMPRVLEELSQDIRRSGMTLGLVKSDTTALQPLLSLLEQDEAEALGQSLLEALKAINARLDAVEAKTSEAVLLLDTLGARLGRIEDGQAALAAPLAQIHQMITQIATVFGDADPPSF